VQEAVLAQWGINVITGEGDDPAASLAAFLEELLRHVQGNESRTVS
jgi:hypothetical protein